MTNDGWLPMNEYPKSAMWEAGITAIFTADAGNGSNPYVIIGYQMIRTDADEEPRFWDGEFDFMPTAWMHMPEPYRGKAK